MFLDAYLTAYGVDLSQLREVVQTHISPDESEIIYLAGSLIEGLGNLRSDIDIYVISERDFTSQFICGSVIIIPFGMCAVDVEVLSFQSVNELVDRLSKFPSDEDRDLRRAVGFSLAELKILHNLVISEPLLGEAALSSLVGRIDKRALSRILFDRSVAAVNCSFDDVLGLIGDGDYLSARYLLNQFLGHLCSALLAALGDTNPGEKWRVRKLNELKHQDPNLYLPYRKNLPDIAELFSDLYIQCGPNAKEVRDTFSRMLLLFNLIVPWGQYRFLSNSPLQPNQLGHEGTWNFSPVIKDQRAKSVEDISGVITEWNDVVLPPLNMNCCIQYDSQGFKLDVLDSKKTFYVNWLAYELLLLFDGDTTVAGAVAQLDALSSASIPELMETILDFKIFFETNNFTIFDSSLYARYLG